jgi:hypothetical protein
MKANSFLPTWEPRFSQGAADEELKRSTNGEKRGAKIKGEK